MSDGNRWVRIVNRELRVIPVTIRFTMKRVFYEINAWHWQGKLPWVVRDFLAYLYGFLKGVDALVPFMGCSHGAIAL